MTGVTAISGTDRPGTRPSRPGTRRLRVMVIPPHGDSPSELTVRPQAALGMNLGHAHGGNTGNTSRRKIVAVRGPNSAYCYRPCGDGVAPLNRGEGHFSASRCELSSSTAVRKLIISLS